MNGRDWITLKILVNQFEEPITVDGRIVGVKEIKEYTDLSKNRLIAIIMTFIFGVTAGLIGNLLMEWILKLLD